MKKAALLLLLMSSLAFSVRAEETTKPTEIIVDSADALIHIGSLDSFDITPAGIEAARDVLSAVETKSKTAAKRAIALFKKLVPKENYGGEYTALQFFCEYIVADEAGKAKLLEDPLTRAYYHFFADNDYKVLREYVTKKYKFSRREKENPEVGHSRRAFLEDFILFNNPHREEWEKTSKIMELLQVQPGQKVLDIGCGPGYYTYKFSKLVGETGKVYALDVKPEHLEFLDSFLKKENITNVETVVSKYDDVVVRPQADLGFMCSLYHIIYAVSPEKERNDWVESIKQAIRPGGKLVIVDNGPVGDRELPYHGPNIARELIIAQMHYYGFKFERYEQIVPQRYLLVFTRP